MISRKLPQVKKEPAKYESLTFSIDNTLKKTIWDPEVLLNRKKIKDL